MIGRLSNFFFLTLYNHCLKFRALQNHNPTHYKLRREKIYWIYITSFHVIDGY